MQATLELHLTRQPILDRKNQLFGYELLYQPERGSGATTQEEVHQATLASLQSMDLRRIAEGKMAMFTLGRGALLSGGLDSMDPTNVLIALEEDIAPDEELVAACSSLKARGFKLALNNLYYDGTQDPLLSLVDYAKIETLALTPDELTQQVALIKGFGVTLIAEQVESEEAYEDCVRMGFDLFQGFSYFQSREPDGKAPSENQIALMRIMNLLGDPNLSDRAVEEAFRTDPSLTFKLLRMVNSAAMGGRDIDSIGHALRLLGRSTVHRWLALVMAQQGGRGEAVRFEVIKSALLRARLCELLRETSDASVSLPPANALFLVGLFSHMDTLTRRPMGDILEGMKISSDVKNALLTREGVSGRILAAVEAYEDADWDRAEDELNAVGVQSEGLSEKFLDALTWASEHLATNTDD